MVGYYPSVASLYTGTILLAGNAPFLLSTDHLPPPRLGTSKAGKTLQRPPTVPVLPVVPGTYIQYDLPGRPPAGTTFDQLRPSTLLQYWLETDDAITKTITNLHHIIAVVVNMTTEHEAMQVDDSQENQQHDRDDSNTMILRDALDY